jgi:chorismate--pyruvate lyase
MIKTKHLNWGAVCDFSIPEQVEHWLTDEQSLTAKLKQKFSDFSLRVCSQETTQPHSHETALLGDNQVYIAREVLLFGNQNPVVFARSIVPITPDTEALLSIGSKPLGEVLFNDSSIQRQSLQITQAQNIWGRRSIFKFKNSKILVSEFFLDELYA